MNVSEPSKHGYLRGRHILVGRDTPNPNIFAASVIGPLVPEEDEGDEVGEGNDDANDAKAVREDPPVAADAIRKHTFDEAWRGTVHVGPVGDALVPRNALPHLNDFMAIRAHIWQLDLFDVQGPVGVSAAAETCTRLYVTVSGVLHAGAGGASADNYTFTGLDFARVKFSRAANLGSVRVNNAMILVSACAPCDCRVSLGVGIRACSTGGCAAEASEAAKCSRAAARSCGAVASGSRLSHVTLSIGFDAAVGLRMSTNRLLDLVDDGRRSRSRGINRLTLLERGLSSLDPCLAVYADVLSCDKILVIA